MTTTILSSGALADLVERMLRTSGRRVDLSQPFVDAMMPDDSRLHVLIPDITRVHLAATCRSSTKARCGQLHNRQRAAWPLDITRAY